MNLNYQRKEVRRGPPKRGERLRVLIKKNKQTILTTQTESKTQGTKQRMYQVVSNLVGDPFPLPLLPVPFLIFVKNGVRNLATPVERPRRLVTLSLKNLKTYYTTTKSIQCRGNEGNLPPKETYFRSSPLLLSFFFSFCFVLFRNEEGWLG